MEKEPKLIDIFQPAVLSKEEQEVFFSVYDNENIDNLRQQSYPIRSAAMMDIVLELIESVEELSKRVNDIRDEIIQFHLSQERQWRGEEKTIEIKPEVMQLSRLQKYKKVSWLERMKNLFQAKSSGN